jgi:hypothetical protein
MAESGSVVALLPIPNYSTFLATTVTPNRSKRKTICIIREIEVFVTDMISDSILTPNK